MAKTYSFLGDKPWYKSMTFWGCTGYAVVGILEAYGGFSPNFGLAAGAITAALVGLGIRRNKK